MRLTDYEINAVVETFHDYFSKEDQLWLFGSRIDDSRKGGDIDLFIETKECDIEKISKLKIEFLLKLESKIGDQKVDLVLCIPGYELPIHQHAKVTGVRLA